MQTFEQGILVGLLIALAGFFVFVFAIAGWSLRRFALGQRLARLAGRDPAVEKQLTDLADGRPREEKPAKPSGEPLRLLVLLQREGRLLDFLLEDIQSYPEAQIGVAVRDIHR